MGWLFSPRWSNRKEMLEHLRSKTRWGDNFEMLKSSLVGNNHWYVAKRSDGLVFIGLDLIKGGTRTYPGYGYKDICASMGPCEVNCPITYLDLAPDSGGYETGWREKVRTYHADKAARRPLEAGLVVEYGDSYYELEKSLGRRGWAVCSLWRNEDTGQWHSGADYRMKSHQLTKARRIGKRGDLSAYHDTKSDHMKKLAEV